MISGHLADSNRAPLIACLFLHIYTHLRLDLCLAVAYCIFFMDKVRLIAEKYLLLNRPWDQPKGTARNCHPFWKENVEGVKLHVEGSPAKPQCERYSFRTESWLLNSSLHRLQKHASRCVRWEHSPSRDLNVCLFLPSLFFSNGLRGFYGT